MTSILLNGGGGFQFWWKLGVLHHLNIDKNNIYYIGISSGNLANILFICDIPLDKIMYESELIFKNCKSIKDAVKVIPQWLDILLPDNAHEICSGRVFTALYKFPNTTVVIGNYESKEILINHIVKSISIPFYINTNFSNPMDHCFDSLQILNDKNLNIFKMRTPFCKKSYLIPTKEQALCMYYDGKDYAKEIKLDKFFGNKYQPNKSNLFPANSKWSDFDIILCSGFARYFIGKIFNQHIGKSLIPFIISLFCYKHFTLEPFIKRRVNKTILYTFIGHTIVDTFYIYKSKSLLLHHLLSIYVSLKARYNIYYSNIIYAAYISEIYPFIGALISVSKVAKHKKWLNFIRILLVCCYRIPYTCYAIYKAEEFPIIRLLGCAYLPLDLYWLKSMLRIKYI